MALKIKLSLLIILFTGNLLANSSLDLFYTDKYDSNYFSDTTISKTELHFGSDLFYFIENENLYIFENFIDSFLQKEKIYFDQNFSINNNTLEVNLFDYNAEECSKLSEMWFEKYNISWIKLLKNYLNLSNIKESNSEIMILKKIYSDEKLRPYHVTNVVNKTLLAFIIPKNLSKNDFKKSQVYLNTKRYTSTEPNFNYTEIIPNKDLKDNEIIFNFPAFNKHTFLKNSISTHIIKKLLTKDKDLKIKYSIAQSFIKYFDKSDSTNLKDFKIDLMNMVLSEKDFKLFMNDAIDEILAEITEDNLFFYSYYDKLKLEQMRYIYLLEDFYKEIKRLENKTKFIIELKTKNNLFYNNIKLEEVHFTDFSDGISFKVNSTKFANEEDTLLISKLNLFLALNKNYNLSIISSSKKSEYLFISKNKKEALLNKYKRSDYIISYSKKLKLYRSLIVFNELIELNTSPLRLNCIGIQKKYMKVNFEFIMIN
tara:strand:+ start:7323 stop:8771 length:1449 start_codon:yes stop_codon:yes gene_type:complete